MLFTEQSMHAMTPAWTVDNANHANAEGWDIFACDGSDYGEWQIQKIDDTSELSHAGDTIPDLEFDEQAWLIVANGKEPHHIAAMAFLKAHSPKAYEYVARFIGKGYTLQIEGEIVGVFSTEKLLDASPEAIRARLTGKQIAVYMPDGSDA